MIRDVVVIVYLCELRLLHTLGFVLYVFGLHLGFGFDFFVVIFLRLPGCIGILGTPIARGQA